MAAPPWSGFLAPFPKAAMWPKEACLFLCQFPGATLLLRTLEAKGPVLLPLK